MSTTEKIRAQAQRCIAVVDAYDKEVRKEYSRYEKACASIRAWYDEFRAEVEQAHKLLTDAGKKGLETDLQDLQQMKEPVQKVEAELNKLIPRSTVTVIPDKQSVGMGSFSLSEARNVIEKISEKSFWGRMKKGFGVDGYQSDEEMAGRLYGQIDKRYAYIDERIRQVTENLESNEAYRADVVSEKLRARAAERDKALEEEKALHEKNMAELERKGQELRENPELKKLLSMIVNCMDTFGVMQSRWLAYKPAREFPDEFLLGGITVPYPLEKVTEETAKLLKSITVYEEKAGGFRSELTVSADTPVHIYAECDRIDRFFLRGYRVIVSRMLWIMPPGQLRVKFFDPVNRGEAMGTLVHLAGEGTAKLCSCHRSEQEIREGLEELTAHMDKVMLRLAGSGFRNVRDYNRKNPQNRIPLTAVVIHNFPRGFDDGSLEALRILAERSSQCGISLVISQETGEKLEGTALRAAEELKSSAELVRYRGVTKKWTIQTDRGEYSFSPGENELTEEMCAQINQACTYKAPLSNGFADFFDLKKLPAHRDPTKGLDIPFAVAEDGQLLELKIGYDNAAYGFISGGVGAGKSRMLHQIISSAILHYHPKDLELWLVDFKETEFSFYTRHCPPHVRHVVADESGEVAYSLIEEITREYRRRIDTFVDAGVENFIAYRRSPSGKANPMPRLMVVIDEFHRMSQAAQEDPSYKLMLENIFAEARAAGIVLLLCDQQISNGLSGLSQKSRDMIPVRIAMRNNAPEIRDVLAADNALLTDQVREMIVETTSGAAGTAIYKYEQADPNDRLSNRIVFRKCRAIYITEQEQKACIDAAARSATRFQREKRFFVGAQRVGMDPAVIEAYEKENPQSPDQGDRFYIGTPLGIGPCFSFNLQHEMGGENILLVGADMEKRMAILKATLSCAYRYGYQVTILAARTSMLYRKNRAFFDRMRRGKVISTFPEICRYIGEKANALRAIYHDEEFGFGTGNRELTVLIGVDEMYAQMEASGLTQQQAWTVEKPEPPAPQSVPVSRPRSVYMPEREAPRPPVRSGDGGIDLSDDIAALSKLLEGMDDGDMLASLKDSFAGDAFTDIRGYNAVQDLALLISDGWKKGIHTMLVADRGNAFRKMNRIRLEGNFEHRIALTMSPDEAQNFMTKTRLLKSLNESGDTISAVYEYMGSREQCFRPYLFT